MKCGCPGDALYYKNELKSVFRMKSLVKKWSNYRITKGEHIEASDAPNG